MNLIPMPKNIKEFDGTLKYKAIKSVKGINDERLMRAINMLPFSEQGVYLEMLIEDGDKEAYELKIESEKILVKAKSNAGAFYAIQTLRQLFEQDSVQCCLIEDEPDFEYRGFYHDVTRGKVPTVETIKRLIDDMAYFKMNSLQLYVEHTFEFKEYADSIEKTGYLTAEEIREIDDYCKMNFIEFIPSLATFGHLYELLQKEQYKHLREFVDLERKEFFWNDRMCHHTIDPTREESFEIIKSLIDQYMVNFSSDRFNICCDETFDLKYGKHKEENTEEMYLNFVIKIINYLQSKGKKVMMWADILLQHPEQIKKLPKNVELLNWFYWENPDENTFKTIRDTGSEQIVCPGTGSWSRLCEDYETEIINISSMADIGYKYGAKGVLNTNWGDWGNPCSIELAMFGMVLGAQKAWNTKTEINDEYKSMVDKLLYHNDNGSDYIRRLSKAELTANWSNLAKSYANYLGDEAYEIDWPSSDELDCVRDECLKIIDEVKSDTWGQDRFKNEIITAAEGIAVIAELSAKQAGYKTERKTNTKIWLDEYCKKWREANKESELKVIEKMFLSIEGI